MSGSKTFKFKLGENPANKHLTPLSYCHNLWNESVCQLIVYRYSCLMIINESGFFGSWDFIFGAGRGSRRRESGKESEAAGPMRVGFGQLLRGWSEQASSRNCACGKALLASLQLVRKSLSRTADLAAFRSRHFSCSCQSTKNFPWTLTITHKLSQNEDFTSFDDMKTQSNR